MLTRQLSIYMARSRTSLCNCCFGSVWRGCFSKRPLSEVEASLGDVVLAAATPQVPKEDANWPATATREGQ